MSDWILDWPAAAARGPEIAGGKGWQLARLAQLGVHVPDGFVIAAAANEAVLPEVEQEVARRGWSALPLAVRSSAPHEDSQHASFAGIHRSVLNVRGPEALRAAIHSVWSSVKEPAAVAYRERLGIQAEDPSIAVVVMPLLNAEASGVIFTCDPITGRDDQYLINAHWGLGEALVGGQVDGDEYRLQLSSVDDSLQVISQRIGAKQQITVADKGGGTRLREASATESGQSVLSPDQAVLLGRIARDAACALDFEQPRYDIEWVWDGNQFHIVQARPVTARARYTYPALMNQPSLWSRGNTKEVLPHPLSPLDWGLSKTMVNQMLTQGYEITGYPLMPGVQHGALYHGRLYLDAAVLQWEAFDAYGIPPESINRLMGGYHGQIQLPAATLRQKLERTKRLLRYIVRSRRQRLRAPEALKRARDQARTWRNEALPADTAELAKLIRHQLSVVRSSNELFFLQGSAGGTLSGLVDLIEKYCPGEGHALTAAVMAGGEPSVTAQQGYDLVALAAVAARDTEALQWLQSPDRIATGWETRLPAASPFRKAFADFLERYGHRGIHESYFRTPRWREQPEYLLNTVLALIGSETASSQRRQRDLSAKAWQRLNRAIPLHVRPLVKFFVRTATIESNNREAARSAFMAYVEVARRAILAVGKRFGMPDDIFNLTLEEILALAEGNLPPQFAARRAAERKAILERWAREPERDVIEEYADKVVSQDTPREFANAEGEWSGTPVGAGVAEGRACVTHAPSDATAMKQGDVLVAPSTDPAWTPFFLKAGALIMETGGYLSHGAIVAREFGIPAVVNIPGIVSQLANGEPLHVDGNRGIVRRAQAS